MKAIVLAALQSVLAISTCFPGDIAVDVAGGTKGLVSGFGGMTLGWEFEVTEGITVDGLGFWDDGWNGFLFGQSFPVGLWNATDGMLLGSSVITSGSTLKGSVGAEGGWRVNGVLPIVLAPGLYRIGALMPESGGNQIITEDATVQTASGIRVVRHLRELGSETLAMPDRPMNFSDDANFGPTFTFTTGLAAPLSAVAPNAFKTRTGGAQVRAPSGDWTYQVQFSGAALAGLPAPAKITGLGFRLSTAAAAGYPSMVVTWPLYRVTLGEAARPIGQMSSLFGSNMRSPVRVMTKRLAIAPNTLPAGASGGSPNEFGTFMILDTPYLYQGGDLVMEFAYVDSDSPSTAVLDGLSMTSAGYGTDFRAFGTNSVSTASGRAAPAPIVQIVYERLPGQSVIRDGTNVVIVGSGGTPARSYQLMRSPDVALPISQWIPVTSSVFDGNGNFRYTNEINGNFGAEFFRMALP